MNYLCNLKEDYELLSNEDLINIIKVDHAHYDDDVIVIVKQILQERQFNFEMDFEPQKVWKEDKDCINFKDFIALGLSIISVLLIYIIKDKYISDSILLGLTSSFFSNVIAIVLASLHIHQNQKRRTFSVILIVCNVIIGFLVALVIVLKLLGAGNHY